MKLLIPAIVFLGLTASATDFDCEVKAMNLAKAEINLKGATKWQLHHMENTTPGSYDQEYEMVVSAVVDKTTKKYALTLSSPFSCDDLTVTSLEQL